MNRTMTTAASAAIALLTLAAFYSPAPFAGGPTPITDPSMVISQPGVYCLTSHMTANANDTGIRVLAKHVVIDLGGFTLEGAGAASTATAISSTTSNVIVRNGSIVNWGMDGVNLQAYARAEDLHVSGCIDSGIRLGAFSVAENCTLGTNGVRNIGVADGSQVKCCRVAATLESVGISTGEGCLVEDVTVQGGSSSILAGPGSMVRNCRVTGYVNRGITTQGFCTVVDCLAWTSSTISLDGIKVGPNSQARDCIAEGPNSVGISIGHTSSAIACQARGAEDIGVLANSESRVIDCTAVECNSDQAAEGGGIVAFGDVLVRGALASRNQGFGVLFIDPSGLVENSMIVKNAGTGVLLPDDSVARNNYVSRNEGPGIRAYGDRAVIQDNRVDLNGHGIQVLGHTGLVTDNRAAYNTGDDYDVHWATAIGPILRPDAEIQGSKNQTNFGQKP